MSKMVWPRAGVIGNVLSAAALAAALVACGGGGDALRTPNPAVAGRWKATSGTGAQGKLATTPWGITGITLSDGTVWIVYSPGGVPDKIGGVVRGEGSVTASTISGLAGDISFGPVTVIGGVTYGPHTVNTSALFMVAVNPRQTISGEVKPCQSSSCTAIVLAFSGTYDPFNDRPANLADVTGTFNGTLSAPAGNETATLQVAADGALSGASASGCTYKGSLRPRSDTNTYDMQVDLSGGPCPAGSFDGIAYMDSDGRSLTVASFGFAFQGTKP